MLTNRFITASCRMTLTNYLQNWNLFKNQKKRSSEQSRNVSFTTSTIIIQMSLQPLHCQNDILSYVLSYIELRERLLVNVLVSQSFREAVYKSIKSIQLRGEPTNQSVQEIVSRYVPFMYH